MQGVSNFHFPAITNDSDKLFGLLVHQDVFEDARCRAVSFSKSPFLCANDNYDEIPVQDGIPQTDTKFQDIYVAYDLNSNTADWIAPTVQEAIGVALPVQGMMQLWRSSFSPRSGGLLSACFGFDL